MNTDLFLRNIGLNHPQNLNGIKRITLRTRILFFEHEFHESHEYFLHTDRHRFTRIFLSTSYTKTFKTRPVRLKRHSGNICNM